MSVCAGTAAGGSAGVDRMLEGSSRLCAKLRDSVPGNDSLGNCAGVSVCAGSAAKGRARVFITGRAARETVDAETASDSVPGSDSVRVCACSLSQCGLSALLRTLFANMPACTRRNSDHSIEVVAF